MVFDLGAQWTEETLGARLSTLNSFVVALQGKNEETPRRMIMSAPEYVICMECETPCYIFEWSDGCLTEAVCEACANDDINQFATEEEYDALAMASSEH